MIYDPSMSDIDEPESVMRRRAENEVMGPRRVVSSVRKADPELEALLDEEERIAHEQGMARLRGRSSDAERTLITFTKHFTHAGREADLEVSTLVNGIRVRVKTVIWKGGDSNGAFQGEMVELKFNFEEWEAFLDMMKVMGRTSNG